jgi:hypothetical protein
MGPTMQTKPETKAQTTRRINWDSYWGLWTQAPHRLLGSPDLAPEEKVVLLALMGHADFDHKLQRRSMTVCVSQRVLAESTGLHQPRLPAILGKLKRVGVIVPMPGTAEKAAVRYSIHLEAKNLIHQLDQIAIGSDAPVVSAEIESDTAVPRKNGQNGVQSNSYRETIIEPGVDHPATTGDEDPESDLVSASATQTATDTPVVSDRKPGHDDRGNVIAPQSLEQVGDLLAWWPDDENGKSGWTSLEAQFDVELICEKAALCKARLLLGKPIESIEPWMRAALAAEGTEKPYVFNKADLRAWERYLEHDATDDHLRFDYWLARYQCEGDDVMPKIPDGFAAAIAQATQTPEEHAAIEALVDQLVLAGAA